MRHTIYGCSGTRYAVRVLDKGQVVHEYQAGNSKYQSDGVVPKDSSSALGPENMVWMSKQTAEEIAEEYGTAAPELDDDLCEELEELEDDE